MSLRIAALAMILSIASAADAQTSDVPGEAAPGPAETPEPPAPSAGESKPEAKQEDLSEPLAGWSDGSPFLRSADNQYVLFPGGRLQIDTYVFKRKTSAMPNDSFLVRRAYLEVFGWIGPWFGVNIAGNFASAPPSAADPVAQSWLATTDNYMLIAPWKENYFIFQAGQYDAPFTLENRTSDKTFDFMERSITVRAFGVPSNKEVGIMAHGLLPSSIAYYSIGMFNGDGQNFYNVDNKFDFMGRAWISPGALSGIKAIENVALGGSFWIGTRGATGLPLKAFTTQGNFAFSETSWTSMMGAMATKNELHQQGALRAWALELDVPVMHRFGLRVEYVHKKQDLSIDDVTMAGTATPLGPAQLRGFSVYGQAWWWILGDDTIIARPGLELPPRYTQFGTKAPQQGVMLAFKVERLDTHIKSSDPMGGPSIGTDDSNSQTAMTSYELGVNYWYSKHFRASINALLNHLDGNVSAISNAEKKNGGRMEDELLFRLAAALP